MRKKFAKRGLAAAVTMAMMLGLLAGCGNGGEESQQEDPNTNEETPENNEGDDTQGDGEALEEVTLRWYVPGNAPQADTDAVEDAIYEYLKDDLNVRVDFIESDWGSYDSKMQTAIASQEVFDLCYTASWSNNFYSNVSKNAFLPLNDLLEEYAPNLMELMPQAGWDATTIDGNIYAVPNYQIWAYQNYVQVNTETLEQYDFDLSTVKELKDIEPLLEAVKADNPDMYPLINCGVANILNNYQNTIGYEEITGSKLPAVLMYDSDELTVVNQYELPEMMEFFQMMYDWNQKGYFRPDSATFTDYIQELTSGNAVAMVAATYKPGVESSALTSIQKEVTVQPMGTAHLSTSGIVAALTSISRTSENPERAMMFLDRVNSDPVLYNMICFGIEGTHYTTDGTYATPVENSAYNPNQDWVYGNQFNAYYREGQGETDWEDTIAINESATPSKAMGFSFDSTPVQTEIASVSAVIDEYFNSLSTGSVNPEEVVPQMLEKLEAAGIDTLIAEAQSQLDDWAAANNK